MSSSVESTQRFFRPPDAGRARRNYRRVQVQRLFAVARNILIVAGIVLGALAAYRHTQSGAQFAVKNIEIDGAVHTPRAALDAITQQYRGMNLFKLDIARVRRDLGALAWVRRVDIEAKIPDTLRIRIAERTPVALVLSDGPVHYVDDDGVTFAELSTAVGDNDLPIISNARGSELARCVALLRDLRARDPQLYARVSEIRPIAPRGFSIFDRELGAFVYADGDELSAKWRDLYAIVANEKLGRIEYVDLRFENRIVIKPSGAAAMPSLSNTNGSVPAAVQD
ncbi:MAG TPA: FtsQ-type POTRA domain-containing protein [Thermoanaerobaculia bacterium]|nr:FtsQ-type POTRA domain-containing protein [Thermoanaerobaculia bacterium]